MVKRLSLDTAFCVTSSCTRHISYLGALRCSFYEDNAKRKLTDLKEEGRKNLRADTRNADRGLVLKTDDHSLMKSNFLEGVSESKVTAHGDFCTGRRLGDLRGS